MPTAIREAEAAEIDAFLAEDKSLEAVPIWRGSSWPGELTAVWNIRDSLGIGRATLRFRCPSSRLAEYFADISRQSALADRSGRVRRMEAQSTKRGIAGLAVRGTRVAQSHLAR
jgi:hypothetical protein